MHNFPPKKTWHTLLSGGKKRNVDEQARCRVYVLQRYSIQDNAHRYSCSERLWLLHVSCSNTCGADISFPSLISLFTWILFLSWQAAGSNLSLTPQQSPRASRNVSGVEGKPSPVPSRKGPPLGGVGGRSFFGSPSTDDSSSISGVGGVGYARGSTLPNPGAESSYTESYTSDRGGRTGGGSGGGSGARISLTVALPFCHFEVRYERWHSFSSLMVF